MAQYMYGISEFWCKQVLSKIYGVRCDYRLGVTILYKYNLYSNNLKLDPPGVAVVVIPVPLQ